MMGEMSNSVIDRCHFLVRLRRKRFPGRCAQATFEARHCINFSKFSAFLLYFVPQSHHAFHMNIQFVYTGATDTIFLLPQPASKDAYLSQCCDFSLPYANGPNI